ncbi:MAG: DUF2279 domain-containing protein [Bacteroidetes bacterium]|nr:MAG: DUF2279 domain-containing protein [Bacteroidota bacterium]
MRLFPTLLLLLPLCLVGQNPHRLGLLEQPDTLHPQRLRLSIIGGSVIYGAAAVGLYHTWYKDFELGKFRTFNDSGEWLQMDKLGHLLTTYQEARLLYDGARWTGLDKKRSRWLAGGISMFLQATVEVMDGFSEKWGFSWSDVGFNTLGMGTFVLQQRIWEEQRIIFKLSSNQDWPSAAPISSTNGLAHSSLRARSAELYGTSLAERALKDYNTMSIWASVNVRSFFPDAPWPAWLNVAVGHGAANLYGGFSNTWTDAEGNSYRIPPGELRRHRQYYLSFDVDLKRIPTRHRGVRTLLSVLNFIKIPAPTLEWNREAGFRGHWLYY